MARKKTSPLMRRTNYYLTEIQVERIDAHSLRTGLDRSAIIRIAVDIYLDRVEQKLSKKKK